MTDSLPSGLKPAADLIAFPSPEASSSGTARPANSGGIAGMLAASGTSPFVRTWLAAALGRDPRLAYGEATALAGMLELLACEEASEWLRPALSAALAEEPADGLAAALDIALALKPAAAALDALEPGLRLPEPANHRG